MPFRVQLESGWEVDVLDSAMRHVSEIEVRGILASREVHEAVVAASATGTILQWTGAAGYGEVALGNGARILIRHARNDWNLPPVRNDPTVGDFVVGSALLVVFHADRGDRYRRENLQTTQDRFRGSGSYQEMMQARQKGM